MNAAVANLDDEGHRGERGALPRNNSALRLLWICPVVMQ